MRKKLPVLLIIGVLSVIAVRSARAAVAGHVVISEVQVAGTGSGHADDEFVELYNPTGSDVDLTGWRLRLGASNNLVASMAGTIRSHGYFLIANPAYSTISVVPDMVYSATSSALSANSYITLQNKSGLDYSNVDRVGMGNSDFYEGAPIPSPAPGKSIERYSDGNGVTEGQGNGWDTDNNLGDFTLRDVPDPQNSNSPIEPLPTTMPSPTLEPTATPEPTVEPSPTELPPTPTSEPFPTPTPVEEPSPTPEPTPTLTPSPTLVPLPTPGAKSEKVFESKYYKCVVSFKLISIWRMKVFLPEVSCKMK